MGRRQLLIRHSSGAMSSEAPYQQILDDVLLLMRHSSGAMSRRGLFHPQKGVRVVANATQLRSRVECRVCP